MGRIRSREQAVECIRGSALAEFAEDIERALLPSVSLHRRRVELADLPVGASRLGGVPDLPSACSWPVWKRSTRSGLLGRKQVVSEERLDFLAQINCAELPREPLPDGFPTEGMIYVFYDIEAGEWDAATCDRGAVRVLFTPSADDLARVDAGASSDVVTCCVEPTISWTLPEEPLPFPSERDDLIEAYLDELCVAFHGEPNGGNHHLFGHGQWVQGNALADHPERVLFLQLDSDDGDDGPGWMWGDAGSLYFSVLGSQVDGASLPAASMTSQCY